MLEEMLNGEVCKVSPDGGTKFTVGRIYDKDTF